MQDLCARQTCLPRTSVAAADNGIGAGTASGNGPFHSALSHTLADGAMLAWARAARRPCKAQPPKAVSARFDCPTAHADRDGPHTHPNAICARQFVARRHAKVVSLATRESVSPHAGALRQPG